MSKAAPFADTLDDMRSRAAAPHPDAGLLIACDRFEEIQDERTSLYRKQAAGYMKRIRATAPELDELEARIASTPARTADGRRAKAMAARATIGMAMGCSAITRSVLQDILNNEPSHGSAT